MGKLTAARDAFARVPADFVEAVIAQQEGPRASAVASNAVKEYLCIRAYLVSKPPPFCWCDRYRRVVHRMPIVAEQSRPLPN